MSIKFEQNPKPDIAWLMAQALHGYSATWYLYEEKFLRGIMVRCHHSLGYDEELLPSWFVAA